MLFYILAGVVFIALVVFLVFAAKNWHWLHVVAVVLVYLTAVPAFYCAGYVLKTRKAVVRQHADALLALETSRNRYYQRVYGAEPGMKGGFGDGSLKAELTRYKLLTMSKGRSWDDSVLLSRTDDQVTFDVPTPAAPAPDDAMLQMGAPDAAAAPAAAPAALAEGMYPLVGSLIYAFQVDSFTVAENRQVGVPGRYLGSYRVVSLQGTQVVTQPQMRMETDIRAGDAVALFEKPPIDTHDAFRRALGFESKDPSIDEFRLKFQNVFPPETFELEASSPIYQKMVDDFSFDGRPITEIDQWLNAQGRPNLNPSSEETMVRVRVLRTLEESVDGTQDMVTSGVFDSLGRANDPELQLGRVARVAAAKEGDDSDVMMLDKFTAIEGYTRSDGTAVLSWNENEQGKTRALAEVYSRLLRDYTAEIEQLEFAVAAVNLNIEEYTRLNRFAEQTLDSAKAQQAVRDIKLSELTQDQQNLKSDLQLAQDYTNQLENRLAQLQQEIRDNYLHISYLHQQSVKEAELWEAAQQ